MTDPGLRIPPPAPTVDSNTATSSSSSSASSNAQHRRCKYKCLHLLRHGVALHNQPEAHSLPPESLFDPTLTAQGFAQVSESQVHHHHPSSSPFSFFTTMWYHLTACNINPPHSLFLYQATAARTVIQRLNPHLVITSPLTRAMQTATCVLAGMDKPPPVIALEIVREAYGAHLPDKRRPKSELIATFSPSVDLTTIPDEDTLWTGSRETVDSVLGRARTLLSELLPRPEKHVLLVSHGVFIQYLLQVCVFVCEDMIGPTKSPSHVSCTYLIYRNCCQMMEEVLIQITIQHDR